MSDNNADYNGSGQDEYFATNDSTQADYRQSQDGYNQPASQPHNPNPYASQQPVQGYAPGTQGNNIPGGTYGNGQPYGQSAAYGSSVPAYGSAAPAYGSRLSLHSLHSPSTASRRTDLRITHNRRRPPIIRSRLSPNTRSPHAISHQPTRSRPTIRRPNSSPAMATRRSRRSSPACSACSSAPSACTTSIWDIPARPWPSCC